MTPAAPPLTIRLAGLGVLAASLVCAPSAMAARGAVPPAQYPATLVVAEERFATLETLARAQSPTLLASATRLAVYVRSTKYPNAAVRSVSACRITSDYAIIGSGRYQRAGRFFTQARKATGAQRARLLTLGRSAARNASTARARFRLAKPLCVAALTGTGPTTPTTPTAALAVTVRGFGTEDFVGRVPASVTPPGGTISSAPGSTRRG